MRKSNSKTKNKKEDVLKKLKLAMAEKYITQTSLAEHLGLSQSAVSAWFKGKGTPDLETLIKSSEFLDKPLNYFFADGGDNIVAGRDNNANKSSERKDLQLLKAEMEIVKKEIENINLKIELLKKKK